MASKMRHSEEAANWPHLKTRTMIWKLAHGQPTKGTHPGNLFRELIQQNYPGNALMEPTPGTHSWNLLPELTHGTYSGNSSRKPIQGPYSGNPQRVLTQGTKAGKSLREPTKLSIHRSNARNPLN